MRGGGQTVYLPAELNSRFNNGYFDVVVLCSMLHHTESPQSIIEDACTYLKPSGKLLIVEPNRRCPMMLLFSLLDKNEWGLLRMGNFKFYGSLLDTDKFELLSKNYTPLTFGYTNKLLQSGAAFFDDFPSGILKQFLPHLFIVAKKLR